jgi:hypothetical protein
VYVIKVEHISRLSIPDDPCVIVICECEYMHIYCYYLVSVHALVFASNSQLIHEVTKLCNI